MKATLGPLGSRGTNPHGWDGQVLVGCCPAPWAWGGKPSGEWPAVPIISCVEEGGSNASSSASGKGKVLCEGQPGVAEDRAFPNIAGLKLSKMGFRLHLGDTGLTDEHGERTGSGWDGVKFPGSNHYRAVVFTCSYNGVDSTPMFWSR